MDAERRVAERLKRIERAKRTGAGRPALLDEARALLAEAEAFVAAGPRGGDPGGFLGRRGGSGGSADVRQIPV
jgi:hypothetical protein